MAVSPLPMPRITVAGLFVAILAIALPVHAQQGSVGVPPQTYLITHLWGSPTAIAADYVAMGGASVADASRDWHGNPASLPSIRSRAPYFSYTRTPFEALPTFVTTSVGYVQPFKDGRLALKVIAFFVRGDGLAEAVGGLNMKAQENDAAIEVGFRVNESLSIGAGTGYISTESDYDIPGGGTFTRLHSRPAGFGGRAGVLATPSKWITAGFSFDAYSERVTQEVPIVGLTSQTVFTSRAYRGGVAVMPAAKTTILLEREYTRVTALEVEVVDKGVWKVGAEQRVDSLALRAGLYGKQPTAGIAWTARGLDLSYAVSRRFARDLPGTGARVQHLVHITRAF